MASVEKRIRDGRTTYLVRWRDESGAQRKKSFPRKVDADRFRAEVEHSLNTGAYVDPVAGKVSFREYAERWRAAQPHRPNTAMRTRSQLERHTYPVLGSKPLASIRHSDVQAWVSGLQMSPSSVRPVYATVRAILSSAMRDRLIGLDPCTRIRFPEVPRTQVVPLTVEQVRALEGAIAERYQALVTLCAGAGLRQGEAFGLQVRDVNFLRRIITVDRQVQPTQGGGAAVGPLKNRASYRTIPVGRTVVDALAAHLAEWPAKGEQFIFTTAAGTPIIRQTFNASVWGPARRAAGVPEAGMHDLRHFFASVLIRAGRSVKTVSERLGHANAAMTLNVYAHLWPSDDDLDRHAVDDVFAPHVPQARPAIGS